MRIGDFGNIGNWTPKDYALNIMVYDEAHKKGSGSDGGGGNNGGKIGCLVGIIIVIAIIFAICISK